jgi:nucleoid-associated protein YgaU
MASFEELKDKYSEVLELIKASNVRLDHLHQDSETGKLVMAGAAPSERIKNRVWDKIKEVDPGFADLSCDLSIDSSIPEPVRTYTVVGGDSLWKIASKHYGNGALYPKIIEANPGKLEDEHSVIHPGDVLAVPED